MSRFRLHRRAVLKGAGGVAIALPFLDIMRPARVASAAVTTTAKRFVAVYTPGGTVLSKWRPSGTETAFTLAPIMAPLAPVRDRLVIFDGVGMNSADGEQHQAGIIAWLTGSKQSSGGTGSSYAGGPSIDQVLATRLSANKKFKSLEMAVRWATGKSLGALSPMNAANFQDNAQRAPIPPRLDPQQIFKDLFGTTNATIEAMARKKSVLDYLDGRYAALATRLGASDRRKVDAHLVNIRDLERRLAASATGGPGCKPPTLIDTSDYQPRLVSNDDGSIRDIPTDAAIPKVGKLMMDMMVMALACDITAVVTLQWSDTEAKHTFPWLNLPEHHHFYQHDGGFRPIECEKIGTWYAAQHAYLLGEMAKVDMGGHSLLDESVVFFGSELQDPPTHSKTNMPFLLAGGGGGLRGGRYLKYGGVSHNDLLVAIFNLFGDPRTTFGTPEHCTGPLANL